MSETQVVSPDQIAIAAKESQEIIAGYTLERRIGSGGFGEVWKASAPGGLEKAVKILYGQFDDQQAETELKSLERIRSLHHPFLLNIERIEICSGRLVIVTELAEASLEDYYAECRKRRLDGIPYEELLKFLRDAADALDYMSSKHGLQHLDVKPDNLLLQGGHVKVADFGLTKDLSQTQVSLVGAFTPLYAPPELYEGCPAPSSDQYSLAIVYQTLLTGIPPFVGRTAAQLAAQHLNSQPNLQPLSVTDRPAVARALSKNPDARFPSCRDFLEELEHRRSGRDERKPRTKAPAQKRRSPDDASDPILAGSTEFVDTYKESAPFKKIEVDETKSALFRPTLFVGLGGIAGLVLRELKQRIAERFGEDARLPGLGFLYLDTDRDAIVGGRRGDFGCLDLNETLAIPLRSPQEYKDSDVDFSSWLSRRWLYNIPRSRKVEGMRPLGRLAFADHQAAIRKKLHEHFTRLVSDEALSVTREQTGLNFQAGPPNVVVLASITGGTGSGAVLDLGYLIRDELSSMALEESRVESLLLFGTDYRDKDRDVAVANALCVIKELDHFRHDGFPSDPTCGLEESADPPYQDTYLFHLGEHISVTGLEDGVSAVTEHLYRSALTQARAYFQSLHEQTAEAAADGEYFHTFWIQHVSSHPDGRLRVQVYRLLNHLIAHWTKPAAGGEAYQIEMAVAPWWEPLAKNLGWERNQLREKSLKVVRGEEGSRLRQNMHEWLAASHPKLALPNARLKQRTAEELIRSAQAGIDNPGEGPGAPILPSLVTAFRAVLQRRAGENAKAFEEALWEGINEWPYPLESARFAIDQAIHHLDECGEDLASVIQQIAEQLAPYEGIARDGGNALSRHAESSPLEFLLNYADLRFCDEVHRALLAYVASLRSSLAAMPAVVENLARTLELMTADNVSLFEGNDADSAHWVQRFDRYLTNVGRRRFQQLLTEKEEAQENWVQELTQDAERFVFFSSVVAPESGRAEAAPATSFFEMPKPQLQGVGGVHSAVLTTPRTNDQSAAQAGQLFGDCLTTLYDADEPLFLCCETRNIHVSTLKNALCDRREDLKDIASRLHARIDVDW